MADQKNASFLYYLRSFLKAGDSYGGKKRLSSQQQQDNDCDFSDRTTERTYHYPNVMSLEDDGDENTVATPFKKRRT